jgi:hypothetical protein
MEKTITKESRNCVRSEESAERHLVSEAVRERSYFKSASLVGTFKKSIPLSEGFLT